MLVRLNCLGVIHEAVQGCLRTDWNNVLENVACLRPRCLSRLTCPGSSVEPLLSKTGF